MKRNKSILQWAVFTCAVLIFIVIMVFLNQPIEGQAATAASKYSFERARVTEIIGENVSPDTWTEGLRLGMQEVVVRIDSGQYKGKELYAVNYLSAYGNIDLKEGTRIIVRMDTNEAGDPFVVSISNYNRSYMLIGLVVLFVLLLILIGGRKGVSAIAGLFFTIISIWFFLIPMIKRGASPIPTAIVLVAVTTFVSLIALNGFSKKTYIAIAGCVGGVTIAGLLAYLAGIVTPINGFNMSEAEELVLRAADGGLKVSGLMVSGVLIASLGAVMDVALTIASAISELHDMKPKAKMSELFRSGINIGKDAMGTMANTLILAFSGASLNMLIMFRVFDYPYIQIFNSDLMTIEIIQGLTGSIGIVLTVPLVAILGASAFGHK
ncbi:MAG: YibE/F family protein [Bacillota bacterium]|nr:YibE/F family protein [Bacillota bacterium]